MSLFDDSPMISGSVRHETIIRDFGRVIAIAPSQFTATLPDTDDVYVSELGDGITASADNITFVCPVNLPDGAKILSVIVRGNSAAAAETWELIKMIRSTGTAVTIASGNINTEDTTITADIVDNSEASYCFATSSLDTGDSIRGAKIKISYQ